MPSFSTSAPAQFFKAVTPSDTVAFTAGPCRGIYVGGAGDVVVIGLDDGAITFSAVPAGSILPLNAKRVNSTSTTATLMVALY